MGGGAEHPFHRARGGAQFGSGLDVPVHKKMSRRRGGAAAVIDDRRPVYPIAVANNKPPKMVYPASKLLLNLRKLPLETCKRSVLL